MAGRWTSGCRLCPTRAAAGRRPLRTALVALALALFIARPGNGWAQALSIDVRSRAAQPGEVLVVTVTTPREVAALSVHAFNVSWPVYQIDNTTWRALLGIDLDQRPGTYPLTVEATAPHVTVEATAPHVLIARRDLTVAAHRFPRRVLQVAPDFVNPPPDVLARISSDNAFMRTVYARSATSAAWRTGFTRQVPGPANSSFGTRSVFNGEARSPHAGTDFLSPAGTPVLAPAAGRIVAARDLFFTGNTVVIDHGLGVFSMLAHLSRIDVHEGQEVTADNSVGLVGATGRVTGPHLHWALRIGAARVDALSALALLGTNQQAP